MARGCQQAATRRARSAHCSSSSHWPCSSSGTAGAEKLAAVSSGPCLSLPDPAPSQDFFLTCGRAYQAF